MHHIVIVAGDARAVANRLHSYANTKFRRLAYGKETERKRFSGDMRSKAECVCVCKCYKTIKGE